MKYILLTLCLTGCNFYSTNNVDNIIANNACKDKKGLDYYYKITAKGYSIYCIDRTHIELNFELTKE